MVRTLVLCGCALTLQAQQGGEELLAHVRAKVAGTVGRLSNYMCTQTVDRMVYLLAAKKPGRLLSSDRLRLDVGAAKSGELYSWAGDNRFHDRTPAEIVGRGVTSNGSFEALLSMIFTTDPVEFSYRGELTEAGRPLAEFAFAAPLEKSHYTFAGHFRVVAAYEGAFLVDPKTFDLVRLTIRTKGLPPEAGNCEAATTLDYHNVRLNDSDLLLPSMARLVIVDMDGTKKVNQTVFSLCREFLGESVVSFGDRAGAPSSNAPAPAPAELALTKGLSFEIALTQDIDTSQAAAGNALRCELVTPIQDGRKLVAPAGTPVTARIVELSRIYGRSPSVLLAFRLETLDLDGTVRTFAARAKRAPPAAGAGVRMVLPDPKGNLRIKSGLKSKWITGE